MKRLEFLQFTFLAYLTLKMPVKLFANQNTFFSQEQNKYYLQIEKISTEKIYDYDTSRAGFYELKTIKKRTFSVINNYIILKEL